MAPTDRAQHEDVIRQAKGELGDEAFAAIWREGLLLGREAAVEAALALCDAIDAGQGGERDSTITAIIDVVPTA
jgi:hypothetical protein